jgi:hypothetical protein
MIDVHMHDRMKKDVYYGGMLDMYKYREPQILNATTDRGLLVMVGSRESQSDRFER